MVYHLQFRDGEIIGFYTQHGKETPVKYKKIGDIPDDKPFECNPSEIFIPNTNKTRIDVLKQYAEYDRTRDDGCDNTFVLGGEAPAVLEKYNYSGYINGLDASGDEIVFRLLDFVCDHFGHDGTKGLSDGRSITDIISFCESNVYIPGKQHNRSEGTACCSAPSGMLPQVSNQLLWLPHIAAIAFKAVRLGCHPA